MAPHGGNALQVLIADENRLAPDGFGRGAPLGVDRERVGAADGGAHVLRPGDGRSGRDAVGEQHA